MTQLSKTFKIAAFLTCCIFTHTTLVLSMPEAVYSIRVPEEYGKVRARWRAPIADIETVQTKENEDSNALLILKGDALQDSKRVRDERESRTIIHIQDAHASLEAQENMARLIHALSTDAQTSADGAPFIQPNTPIVVGVEGAVGSIKTDIYRDFPIDEVRARVAREYLKKGIFSGAEYSAITAATPLDLFGAEDETLFTENFKEYYASQARRETQDKKFLLLKESLKRLEKANFSDELLAFLSVKEEYRSGNRTIEEFLPVLLRYIKMFQIDMYQYPSLMQCIESLSQEKEISIDVQKLMSELRECAWSVEQYLSRTQFERDIILCGYYVEMAESQAKLEVYDSDKLFFEKHCAAMNAQDVVRILSAGAPESEQHESLRLLNDAHEGARQFYQNADKRSIALLENTLNRMDEKALSTAILVAGGYHSSVIEAECRKRGISYLTISPTIADLTKTVPYIEKMTGSLFALSPHLTSNITGLSLYLMQPAHKIALWKELSQKEIAETIHMIVRSDPKNESDMQRLTRTLLSYCKDAHALSSIDDATVERTIQTVREMQGAWQAGMKSFSRILREQDVIDTLEHETHTRREEQTNELFALMKTKLERFYERERAPLIETKADESFESDGILRGEDIHFQYEPKSNTWQSVENKRELPKSRVSEKVQTPTKQSIWPRITLPLFFIATLFVWTATAVNIGTSLSHGYYANQLSRQLLQSDDVALASLLGGRGYFLDRGETILACLESARHNLEIIDSADDEKSDQTEDGFYYVKPLSAKEDIQRAITLLKEVRSTNSHSLDLTPDINELHALLEKFDLLLPDMPLQKMGSTDTAKEMIDIYKEDRNVLKTIARDICAISDQLFATADATLRQDFLRHSQSLITSLWLLVAGSAGLAALRVLRSRFAEKNNDFISYGLAAIRKIIARFKHTALGNRLFNVSVFGIDSEIRASQKTELFSVVKIVAETLLADAAPAVREKEILRLRIRKLEGGVSSLVSTKNRIQWAQASLFMITFLYLVPGLYIGKFDPAFFVRLWMIGYGAFVIAGSVWAGRKIMNMIIKQDYDPGDDYEYEESSGRVYKETILIDQKDGAQREANYFTKLVSHEAAHMFMKRLAGGVDCKTYVASVVHALILLSEVNTSGRSHEGHTTTQAFIRSMNVLKKELSGVDVFNSFTQLEETYIKNAINAYPIDSHTFMGIKLYDTVEPEYSYYYGYAVALLIHTMVNALVDRGFTPEQASRYGDVSLYLRQFLKTALHDEYAGFQGIDKKNMRAIHDISLAVATIPEIDETMIKKILYTHAVYDELIYRGVLSLVKSGALVRHYFARQDTREKTTANAEMFPLSTEKEDTSFADLRGVVSRVGKRDILMSSDERVLPDGADTSESGDARSELSHLFSSLMEEWAKTDLTHESLNDLLVKYEAPIILALKRYREFLEKEAIAENSFTKFEALNRIDAPLSGMCSAAVDAFLEQSFLVREKYGIKLSRGLTKFPVSGTQRFLNHYFLYIRTESEFIIFDSTIGAYNSDYEDRILVRVIDDSIDRKRAKDDVYQALIPSLTFLDSREKYDEYRRHYVNEKYESLTAPLSHSPDDSLLAGDDEPFYFENQFSLLEDEFDDYLFYFTHTHNDVRSTYVIAQCTDISAVMGAFGRTDQGKPLAIADVLPLYQKPGSLIYFVREVAPFEKDDTQKVLQALKTLPIDWLEALLFRAGLTVQKVQSVIESISILRRTSPETFDDYAQFAQVAPLVDHEIMKLIIFDQIRIATGSSQPGILGFLVLSPEMGDGVNQKFNALSYVRDEYQVSEIEEALWEQALKKLVALGRLKNVELKREKTESLAEKLRAFESAEESADSYTMLFSFLKENQFPQLTLDVEPREMSAVSARSFFPGILETLPHYYPIAWQNVHFDRTVDISTLFSDPLNPLKEAIIKVGYEPLEYINRGGSYAAIKVRDMVSNEICVMRIHTPLTQLAEMGYSFLKNRAVHGVRLNWRMPGMWRLSHAPYGRYQPHPSLSSIYEAGKLDNDIPYVIMDYFEHEQFDNITVRDHHTNTFEPLAWRLMSVPLQILAAYHYLKQQGVYVADPNGKNILVNEDHKVVLIDFDDARIDVEQNEIREQIHFQLEFTAKEIIGYLLDRSYVKYWQHWRGDDPITLRDAIISENALHSEADLAAAEHIALVLTKMLKREYHTFDSAFVDLMKGAPLLDKAPFRDMNDLREITNYLWALDQKIHSPGTMSTIMFKGGRKGGLHHRLRMQVLEVLRKHYEVYEGAVVFMGYDKVLLRWHKRIIYFIKRLKNVLPERMYQEGLRIAEEKDEDAFSAWIEEFYALTLESEDVYGFELFLDFVTHNGQQILLRRKAPREKILRDYGLTHENAKLYLNNRDFRDVPEQDFTKMLFGRKEDSLPNTLQHEIIDPFYAPGGELHLVVDLLNRGGLTKFEIIRIASPVHVPYESEIGDEWYSMTKSGLMLFILKAIEWTMRSDAESRESAFDETGFKKDSEYIEIEDGVNVFNRGTIFSRVETAPSVEETLQLDGSTQHALQKFLSRLWSKLGTLCAAFSPLFMPLARFIARGAERVKEEFQRYEAWRSEQSAIREDARKEERRMFFDEKVLGAFYPNEKTDIALSAQILELVRGEWWEKEKSEWGSVFTPRIAETFIPLLSDCAREAGCESLESFYGALTRNESNEQESLKRYLEISISRLGLTFFFREMQSYEKDLLFFVRRMVREKWNARDCTIAIRHVSSSSGPEVYSNLFVVYDELKKLHESLDTNESFYEWLTRWTITVDAFDANPLHALRIKNPVYDKYSVTIRASGDWFFEHDMNDFFVIDKDGERFRVRDEILKSVSINFKYIDLEKPDHLQRLAEKKYDMTFSLFTFYNLSSDVLKGFVFQALRNSAKSTHLFVYDYFNVVTINGKVERIKMQIDSLFERYDERDIQQFAIPLVAELLGEKGVELIRQRLKTKKPLKAYVRERFSNAARDTRAEKKYPVSGETLPIATKSYAEENLSAARKVYAKLVEPNAADYGKDFLETCEYLYERRHVLGSELTLIVTDEIASSQVYAELEKQVALLDLRVERFNEDARYDARRHIILAAQNVPAREREEARSIKRENPDVVLISFNAQNAASFIEFLPKLMATILWFKDEGRVRSEALFTRISQDTLSPLALVVIDGAVAETFLSALHKEFLSEQFTIAA